MRWHALKLAGLLLGLSNFALGGELAIDPDFTFGHAMPVERPSPGRPYTFNWSDFPVKLRLNQSLTYNDNVLGLAHGQPTPFNISRGDFSSLTSLGGSTVMYVGGQQFFADANYGVTRYKIDTSLNTHQYSLDGGVNWVLGSRCSGRLVAAANQYQSPIEEQIAPGVNTITAKSLNESSKCQVSANVSTILDSGWSTQENSQAASSGNNNTSKFVRGGLEYAATGVDTFQAFATYTIRDFANRSTSTTLMSGLASEVDQNDYLVRYRRLLTPSLTFDGSLGLAELTPLSATSSTASSTQRVPFYSASALWTATPKLTFGAAMGRSVGAPTSLLANAQISDTRSVTVNYLFSPKLSFQLGLAQSVTNASGAVGFGQRASQSQQRSISAFLSAAYSITPFVNITASYRYSDRKSQSADTTGNTFLIGLAYRPY